MAPLALNLKVTVPDNLVLRCRDMRAGSGAVSLGDVNLTAGGEFTVRLADGTTRPWREAMAAFDPDAFDIRREFVTTADGARVPLFVAHRKK